MEKKRFAIAGVGVRGLCFAKAITRQFAHAAELVALYDLNRLRMQGFRELLACEVPSFTDFGTMAREARPTHLIITTPDYTHDELIALAFQAGMEVVCEKPLATEAAKLRRILQLEQAFGRRVVVAFNYRYMPYHTFIKSVMQDNRLGTIHSVNLGWMLDHVHGQEYFRRWHAHMARSGGLLVHKASHHFDLVNWFIDDVPEEIFAWGDLRVYGGKGPFRGERCRTCQHAERCPAAMKTHLQEDAVEIFEKLYWQAESEDRYVRDRCVFRPDIDIYDTMNVMVRYRQGACLNYALNAYSPLAGYRLDITGARGRIEASQEHSGTAMLSERGQDAVQIMTGTNRGDQKCDTITMERDLSEHGGGDVRMYRQLFEGAGDDPQHCAADSRAGVMSCIVGIAANASIRAGRPVRVSEVLGEEEETGGGLRARS
ncbi:MAG: Gfo/Idh/MocA family oxidoreductase [Candidatus Marinimicrobia bacterium]|nr:Gfo/Idh/MocA family oxidoreductase [Candidatus Neomarinimicrobiota bacterium]